MTKKEIADILKKCRLNAGLTQNDVAAKINRPQQTIGSWETGKSQPDANTLFELCDLYGVSVNEAFGYSAKDSINVTDRELEIIKKYRALDERGKVTIDTMLDREYAASARISEIAKDAVSTVKGIAALREAENEIAVGKK